MNLELNFLKMSKFKKMSKFNKEKKLSLQLKKQFLSCAARAVLHNCQNDFDANVEEPFFLFFQRFLGEYSKYECPKMLSATHRSSRVFKVTELYNCMKLRYTTWKCLICRHYFTTFNTTKPTDEWESDKMPKLATAFLEKEGHILCTDCVILAEAIF